LELLAQINERIREKKQIALLIDPEEHSVASAEALAKAADAAKVDFILVGGSYVSTDLTAVVHAIKGATKIPVMLFPGSPMQVAPAADALLLLTLISGRNPDYLIGNHVLSSGLIRKSGLEVIPVGYMLIDGGATTSVQYISNTNPIPANKPDLAVATAIAGEMLGLKMIYLEAGSGAPNPVPADVITAVKNAVKLPLIVGGGLRSEAAILDALDAGADMVVVGNAAEGNPAILANFAGCVHQFSIK
jgi:putative glycerol-1-phosphate prenyltransferase